MNKKYLGIIIGSILMLSLIGIVFAQEEVETIPENIPFNFISWFKHTFGIQDFSIIGDSRQCDRTARKTLYFYPSNGDFSITIKAEDYCSSGYGLIDIFTNNWRPYREYKNKVFLLIANSNYEKITAEIYCCPFDECDKNSDCEEWYGAGSECKTRTANDPNIDYRDSTFNYCTEPSGIEVTCWYYPGSGSSCLSRTYIGDAVCPSTYMSYKLYSFKSLCESQINGNGDGNGNGNGDSECISHYNKKCWDNNVYWYDSCGMREEKEETCDYGCLSGVCKSVPINGDGNGNGNGDNGDDNGEVPSFDLNQVLFKIGEFGVTILTLLIFIVSLFVIKIMFSKK